MSETIIWECNFWLYSLAAGVFMSFVYDIIRIFRKLIPHNYLFINIEDIIYWIACFFMTFIWLYYYNNGVIRFVVILGAGLGMIIYEYTIGRFVVNIAYFLISSIIGKIRVIICKTCINLHKVVLPVNRIFTRFFGKNFKKKLFHGYRLTMCKNHHKIDLRNVQNAYKKGNSKTNKNMK